MKISHETPDIKQRNVEKTQTEFSQFTTRYEPETSSIWCWMQPDPRPCVNTTLIDELHQFQYQITNAYKKQRIGVVWPFHHLILASKIPGIYNLGGDLELFRRLISSGDKDTLRNYAYKAIDLLISNVNNLNLPITAISLIQGQALGGGFEMALSCDVIIAEHSSQLGFPEIMFNLFPGMGAYNLLARRIGSALAERIILSGETYSAGELYDMGVIDVLAEDGEGILVTKEYMKSHNQSHKTIRSMKKIRQIDHPITSEKLYKIVNIWIDVAMDLSEKDLSKMERVLQLQKNTKSIDVIKQQNNEPIRRLGEWRRITDVEFPLITHLGESVTHNRRKCSGRRRKSYTKPEPQYA